MFFLTQIKKADTFSAIDVAGRRLTFAGNLPCQAGDTVWTDGRVIFGNTQNQSSPFFFNDSGGIPVLSDNLRGYFDKNGSFHNYSIATGDFIFNNLNFFYHNNQNIETVFDADFSPAGDIFTVSATNNGFFLFKDNLDVFSSTVTVRKNNSVIDSFSLKSLDKVNSWLSRYEDTLSYTCPQLSVFNKSFASQLIAANVDTNGNTEFVFGTFASASVGYPMTLISSDSFSKEQFLNHTFLWESQDSILYPDYNLKTALIALWEYLCGAEIVDISVDSYKISDNHSNIPPTLSAEYIFHKKADNSILTLRTKTKESPFFWRYFDSKEFYRDDPQLRQFYFSFEFYSADLADPQYHCGKNNLPHWLYITLLNENDKPYYPEVTSPRFEQPYISAFAWCLIFNPAEYPEIEDFSDRTLVQSNDSNEDPESIIFWNWVYPTNYRSNHDVPLVMSYRTFFHIIGPNGRYFEAIDFDNPPPQLGNPQRLGLSTYYRFCDLHAPSEPAEYSIKTALSGKESFFFKFTDKNGKVHQQWLLRPDNNGTIPNVFISVDSASDLDYLKMLLFDDTVDNFLFPIQDNFYAQWHIQSPQNLDFSITDNGFFKFNHSQPSATFQSSSIFDSNSSVVGSFKLDSSHSDNQDYFFDSLPNLSIAPLSNNNFLVGAYNQGLFNLSPAGYSKFDSGFKNFRLRYLNNIAMAKK